MNVSAVSSGMELQARGGHSLQIVIQHSHRWQFLQGHGLLGREDGPYSAVPFRPSGISETRQGERGEIPKEWIWVKFKL